MMHISSEKPLSTVQLTGRMSRASVRHLYLIHLMFVHGQSATVIGYLAPACSRNVHLFLSVVEKMLEDGAAIYVSS